MTSPNIGRSGSSTRVVKGAPEMPDFRPMLLPARSKPHGIPRDRSMDNLIKRIRQGRAKPQYHITRMLVYRRHVLGEPLDQVLAYHYSQIAFLRSLEDQQPGDLAPAIDMETLGECALNRAQNALILGDISGPSVADYWRASAQYRAAHDLLDATVMEAARLREVA
jgi:hypothetical protein